MHSVHGTIRKAPFIKDLGTSTMFSGELSEVVKDYKTGEKSYTNYKFILFAKTPAAIDYYTKATAEGSFVVVTSEKLKVETFEAQSGKTYITLMMDNSRLEGANFDSNAQPMAAAPQSYGQAPVQVAPQPQYQQRPAQQAAPAQAAPQQPAVQYNEPPMTFDDDLPF